MTLIEQPTNLALAFTNNPPMRWRWVDETEILASQFASTPDSTVEISGLPPLFVDRIIVGNLVYIPILGRVTVLSKKATAIIVDFDATAYTPADTEIRLLEVTEVTITVAGQTTPFRVVPNSTGVYQISAMELVRRAFNYPIPTEAEQTRVTYSSSLSATQYTALRSAAAPQPDPSSVIFGQWPFRSILTTNLNEAQPYLLLPVSSASGSVDPSNIITPIGATVIIAQPNTPIVLRFINLTLLTEPNVIPDWMQMGQDGGDVIAFGTIPMGSPDNYFLEYAEGANSYEVTIDVPQTLYPDSCIDGRFGVAWLGQNGQFKTYYFNRFYTESFEQVSGNLTRTGDLQRFVGLDELRKGVTVSETPLSNDLNDWLVDFMISPVFYALDENGAFARRMYLLPQRTTYRVNPRKASRNSVNFTLIYSEKTPTIYEG